MNWKLATFVLTALLLITLIVSYVITCDALRGASATTGSSQERQNNLHRALRAVHDTESFLNFFRLTDPDELTAEDYRREIGTLKSKYMAHYPDWAETQVDLETFALPNNGHEN